MTIRILNPLDWQMLPAGQGLKLEGEHQRIVKIEVNAEAPTRVDLLHHDDDGVERTTFLGTVLGLEKIEVVAGAGSVIGFTSDGEVWFFTNDGVATVVEADEASFTKLVGRKTRNEQLEQIIQMQQLGIIRLVAAQESERIARELAEEQLAAAAEREAANAAAIAEPSGGGAQPPAPEPAPAAAAGEAPSVAPAVPTVPA